MRFERARTNEQIQERKKEILKACAELYDEEGIDGVHFKALSEKTSFVRSTIYTYYKTKEEVLLDLLLLDTKAWAENVNSIIKNNQSLSKEDYCRELASTFVNNIRMLKLMSILYSILEKNCSLEKLTEFKGEFMGLIKPLTDSVYKFFPESQDEAKQTFLYNSSCFVTGLYPTTNISEKQKKALINSGQEFHQLDFGHMCYKGLLALASAL